MRRVSVSELKDRLSHYLRLVKKGETLEIVERGVPIARVGAIGAPASSDEVLERLVRAGIVTPQRGKLDRSFLRKPPLPCGGDPLQVLLDSRGGL